MSTIGGIETNQIAPNAPMKTKTPIAGKEMNTSFKVTVDNTLYVIQDNSGKTIASTANPRKAEKELSRLHRGGRPRDRVNLDRHSKP